ncbi:MAG: hypothetical protein WCJ53_14435 [Mycobacteriaceae bacterium]
MSHTSARAGLLGIGFGQAVGIVGATDVMAALAVKSPGYRV